MVKIKRCIYGSCRHDSRYPHLMSARDVFFIPFPKPIRNLEKCKKWIKLCNRKDDFGLHSIKAHSFICSVHFVGANGPTEEHPDPVRCDEKHYPLGREEAKKLDNVNSSETESGNENCDLEDIDPKEFQQVTLDFAGLLPDSIKNENVSMEEDECESQQIMFEVTDLVPNSTADEILVPEDEMQEERHVSTQITCVIVPMNGPPVISMGEIYATLLDKFCKGKFPTGWSLTKIDNSICICKCELNSNTVPIMIVLKYSQDRPVDVSIKIPQRTLELTHLVFEKYDLEFNTTSDIMRSIGVLGAWRNCAGVTSRKLIEVYLERLNKDTMGGIQRDQVFDRRCEGLIRKNKFSGKCLRCRRMTQMLKKSLDRETEKEEGGLPCKTATHTKMSRSQLYAKLKMQKAVELNLRYQVNRLKEKWILGAMEKRKKSIMADIDFPI